MMGTPPAPPPGFTTAPAPRSTFPRPLTIVAPAEALARVYAAAYLSSSTKNQSQYGATITADARQAAGEAVRDFCRLCTEEFAAGE